MVVGIFELDLQAVARIGGFYGSLVGVVKVGCRRGAEKILVIFDYRSQIVFMLL